MQVVLLLGPSSAGKSSLCRELVTAHGWKSFSIDEVVLQTYQERSLQLKPLMMEELNKHGLIKKLESLMTEEEIQNFCGTGVLNISKGDHLITEHHFPNPSLPDLEGVLKKAGFNSTEVDELAQYFRLVTELGDKIMMAHPFPDVVEKLYDQAFDTANSQDSVILDVVPSIRFNIDPFLAHFHERGKQYAGEHTEESVKTLVVLAYCPPKKLSERILKRNIEAASQGNPMDKREGMFPFYQLATLVTAKNKESVSPHEHELSKNELFDITASHHVGEHKETAIFIENPVDLQTSQNIDEKPTFIVNDNGTVKLQLDSDENQSPVLEKSRIGTKQVINEFENIAKKLGFFENQEQASLIIPDREKFDAVINTATGTSSSLANEMLEQLETAKKITLKRK